MNIKVDENQPVECVSLLREAGHDVRTVKDQDLVGADDATLAEACAAERRVLLSLDLDFADIRIYRPADRPGIVVFRLRPQDGATMQRVVARLLALFKHESPDRKLWVVEEEKVRIRD